MANPCIFGHDRRKMKYRFTGDSNDIIKKVTNSTVCKTCFNQRIKITPLHKLNCSSRNSYSCLLWPHFVQLHSVLFCLKELLVCLFFPTIHDTINVTGSSNNCYGSQRELWRDLDDCDYWRAGGVTLSACEISSFPPPLPHIPVLNMPSLSQ